jgi:hypothetical protein
MIAVMNSPAMCLHVCDNQLKIVVVDLLVTCQKVTKNKQKQRKTSENSHFPAKNSEKQLSLKNWLNIRTYTVYTYTVHVLLCQILAKSETYSGATQLCDNTLLSPSVYYPMIVYCVNYQLSSVYYPTSSEPELGCCNSSVYYPT